MVRTDIDVLDPTQLEERARRCARSMKENMADAFAAVVRGEAEGCLVLIIKGRGLQLLALDALNCIEPGVGKLGEDSMRGYFKSAVEEDGQ